jgi:hypothetical protein
MQSWQHEIITEQSWKLELASESPEVNECGEDDDLPS